MNRAIFTYLYPLRLSIYLSPKTSVLLYLSLSTLPSGMEKRVGKGQGVVSNLITMSDLYLGPFLNSDPEQQGS